MRQIKSSCVYAYTQAMLSRWGEKTCSTACPPLLPSPSAPSLLLELILIFLWKACVRCNFTWVEWNKRSFVAGSGFGLEGERVYILEVWWCVPCGWTTNCCAEQYMAYRRGVSEARGSCQRCLSVMVLLRQGMLLKSMQPEIIFGRSSEQGEEKKKGEEMHYSGPCRRMMTEKEIVYFSSRQAQLFLHSPISSRWKIGWKINEIQGRNIWTETPNRLCLCPECVWHLSALRLMETFPYINLWLHVNQQK